MDVSELTPPSCWQHNILLQRTQTFKRENSENHSSQCIGCLSTCAACFLGFSWRWYNLTKAGAVVQVLKTWELVHKGCSTWSAAKSDRLIASTGVLLVFVFNFCFNFERSDQYLWDLCDIIFLCFLWFLCDLNLKVTRNIPSVHREAHRHHPVPPPPQFRIPPLSVFV